MTTRAPQSRSALSTSSMLAAEKLSSPLQIVMDEAEDGYLRRVCDYTHLNPVRAKIVDEEEALEGSVLKFQQKGRSW